MKWKKNRLATHNCNSKLISRTHTLTDTDSTGTHEIINGVIEKKKYILGSVAQRRACAMLDGSLDTMDMDVSTCALELGCLFVFLLHGWHFEIGQVWSSSNRHRHPCPGSKMLEESLRSNFSTAITMIKWAKISYYAMLLIFDAAVRLAIESIGSVGAPNKCIRLCQIVA